MFKLSKCWEPIYKLCKERNKCTGTQQINIYGLLERTKEPERQVRTKTQLEKKKEKKRRRKNPAPTEVQLV